MLRQMAQFASSFYDIMLITTILALVNNVRILERKAEFGDEEEELEKAW